MEYIVSIIAGISLSAACGFRVFVPLLIMSLTSMLGLSELAADEQWIASTPAMIAFSVATVLEISAYYIPWIDNMMDTIATPLALIAGVITMSNFVTEFDPLVGWTFSVVTGGGVALAVQLVTVKARALSTGFTGGFGNFVISTGELILSFVVSVMALFIPVLAFAIVVLIIYFIAKRIKNSLRKQDAEIVQ